LTKWVKQFRLGIAINRRFECSVFSVQDAEDVIAQVVCQLIGAILLGCEEPFRKKYYDEFEKNGLKNISIR